MAFKFVAFLTIFTIANAAVIPVPQVYHPAPVATTVLKTVSPVAYAHAQPHFVQHHDDHYDHPQYKFEYEVNDEITGDNHSQQEERDGDVVKGEYSLIDADGFKRVVQYTVDGDSGFNAVVNRIPLEHQVKHIVKQVPTPVHYVAPAPTTTVVKQYPVPVAYHQHH